MRLVHRWRWGAILDRLRWDELSLMESPRVLYEVGEAGKRPRAIYFNKTKSITGLNTHKQSCQTSEVKK